MLCCKVNNNKELPETRLDRGDWVAKTSQWLMIVGVGLATHAFVNGNCHEWVRAFIVALVFVVVGLFGFNWGMCMRNRAYESIKEGNGKKFSKAN